MTTVLADLHRAHKARHQTWNARAVHDDGIDFKRSPRHVILRAVVATQPTIRHEPPPMIVPIKRVEVSQPPKPIARPPTPTPFRQAFSVKNIINEVADRHGMLSSQLTGPERFAILMKPRFMAMYLVKAIVHLSTVAIGRHFGGRDHSTAIHAIRRATEQAHRDFQFGSELAALECAIRRRNP